MENVCETEPPKQRSTATVLSVTTRTVFLGDATTLYAEIPLTSIVAVA